MYDKEKFSRVKNIFTSYLEKKNLRKTYERYKILEEVYNKEEHFDSENFFIEIKNKGLHISRATVYNTLTLLVECDLVTKHRFGKKIAQYEKSYGAKQHDHLICTECHKIIEFCDPRIQNIQIMAAELLNFQVFHHSLHLYGVCGACQIKKKL